MRSRKTINQINVVPYIDVMLVLLVIFMVTAPLITPGEIPLPTVGHEIRQVPPSAVRVRVGKQGALSLRDERAPTQIQRVANIDQLVEAIASRQQSRPDQAVVIEADRTVPYGEVVAVLDRLQQAKIAKVGLLVHPPQK